MVELGDGDDRRLDRPTKSLDFDARLLWIEKPVLVRDPQSDHMSNVFAYGLQRGWRRYSIGGQWMFTTNRWLIAFMLLLGLSCGNDEVADTGPIPIGTNIWIGYEPLYVARELSLFPGRAPRLVEYSSATQALSAFRSGVIDAAALTLDEAVLLSHAGLDVRVVLVFDYSDGADVLLGKPEVEDRDDAALEIMSKRLKLSVEQVRAAMEGVHFPDREENLEFLVTPRSGLEVAVSVVVDFMVAEQLLAADSEIKLRGWRPETAPGGNSL